MITDARGRIQYVNSGFDASTGYGRDGVLGRTPRVLKSGCMNADFYRRMWRRIRSGRALRCVFMNRKKDGTLFHEDKTISPLRDEQGSITHFISSARDVTDRTLAEQERLARETANRGACPPSDFDFRKRVGIGTGLGLVHALLPRNGAELTFSQCGAWVRARLLLRPPLLEPTHAAQGRQPTPN